MDTVVTELIPSLTKLRTIHLPSSLLIKGRMLTKAAMKDFRNREKSVVIHVYWHHNYDNYCPLELTENNVTQDEFLYLFGYPHEELESDDDVTQDKFLFLFGYPHEELESDDDVEEDLTEQEATIDVSSTSEEETIDGDATPGNQFELEDTDQAEGEVYFLLKVA